MIYFNLDVTLTEMRRGFDEMLVDVLRSQNIEDNQINPTLYTKLFFSYFNDLQPLPRKQAFKAYAQQQNINSLHSAKAAKRYEELELNATTPRAKTVPIIKAVSEAMSVGIITTGTTRLQRQKLRKLKIHDWLDDIRITYDENQTKQDILADLAETKDRLVYVSHDDQDIKAASNADWQTVQSTVDEVSVKALERINQAS